MIELERLFNPVMSKKIAITGKGGSGKTMLTAVMTKLLANKKVGNVVTVSAPAGEIEYKIIKVK